MYFSYLKVKIKLSKWTKLVAFVDKIQFQISYQMRYFLNFQEFHNFHFKFRDSSSFLLFLKKIEDVISPFVEPLIPLFWTSRDIFPRFEFKARVFCHLCKIDSKVYPSTRGDGATPSDLLIASMAAEPFSSTYLYKFVLCRMCSWQVLWDRKSTCDSLPSVHRSLHWYDWRPTSDVLNGHMSPVRQLCRRSEPNG